MSIENGRAYFRALGLEDRVQEFTVSSATVELAALALGVEGARIAKTLSFKTDDGCMLILAAGDARIDNHKFKEKFHMKFIIIISLENFWRHIISCSYSEAHYIFFYLISLHYWL